jgi:nitroimidazol reductase NimA-like FMN-containing flavoprotein (pyridoxamine 5'-phosphate oxidase superfamily)
MTPSVTQAATPTVRTLDRAECDAVLGRTWIGRIAFSFHDRVDIEPIHFVYDSPWIFGRTRAGAKLLALAHNQWCAFEADDVHGLYDWESVVAKGAFIPSTRAGDSSVHERGLAAFRKLIPEAFTDDDRTPHRDVMFAIHVSEISGRSSVSWHAASRAGAATGA